MSVWTYCSYTHDDVHTVDTIVIVQDNNNDVDTLPAVHINTVLFAISSNQDLIIDKNSIQIHDIRSRKTV